MYVCMYVWKSLIYLRRAILHTSDNVNTRITPIYVSWDAVTCKHHSVSTGGALTVTTPYIIPGIVITENPTDVHTP